MGGDRNKQNMIKSIHSPSVFIGALVASVLFSLGLSFPTTFESLVGFWAVGVLVALMGLEYGSSSSKRLQVK